MYKSTNVLVISKAAMSQWTPTQPRPGSNVGSKPGLHGNSQVETIRLELRDDVRETRIESIR